MVMVNGVGGQRWWRLMVVVVVNGGGGEWLCWEWWCGEC